jgi:hypothetical protein
MEEIPDAYNILFIKPEGKRTPEGHRRRERIILKCILTK